MLADNSSQNCSFIAQEWNKTGSLKTQTSNSNKEIGHKNTSKNENFFSIRSMYLQYASKSNISNFRIMSRWKCPQTQSCFYFCSFDNYEETNIINSPFGDITIKYSACPLINYPLQISFPTLNFSEEKKNEFMDTHINFMNKYI